MTPTYRLHYAPDNASLVIRLALDEIGQPYQTVLVDRAARAQKSPGYLRLNPAGLIPTLETPDGPISETGAILLWLADRHGALAPAPGSPERAAFLKWLFFASNTLHTAARMRFYPDQYVGPDTDAQAALRARMAGEIRRFLDMLEAEAETQPGWFRAPAPSCLDFYVACICRWVALYPKDEDKGWFRLSDWPQIHAMAARLDHCKGALVAIDAEGLGDRPFSAPRHPTPPEGSAV